MGGRLPTHQFQQLVPSLREKGCYPQQPPRPVCWPAYTCAQINSLKTVLAAVRESVDAAAVLPVRGKVGRPLTDPHSLAKAVLFCEFIQLPERQAQGWLEVVGPFLDISERLDDRVIGEAYARPEVAFILGSVFEGSKTSDGVLSGDGTGLETSRKQNYETQKNRRAGEYMTSIIDSREVVQAFDISGTQECVIMKELIKYVTGASMRLDAGFNDRDLVDAIAKLGMIPFVFPRKNNVLNGRLSWKTMYLNLLADVVAWLKEYHQRSHCESFHSSFKQEFGILTKDRFPCRLVQVTARVILHNWKRLFYFQLLGG